MAQITTKINSNQNKICPNSDKTSPNDKDKSNKKPFFNLSKTNKKENIK